MSSLPMIQGGGSGYHLNTGEYIYMDGSHRFEKGTIENNTYNIRNEYTSFVIGVKDYSSVTINGTARDIVAYNNISDATKLTYSANVSVDISNYSYLQIYNWNSGTFTFA